MLIASLVALSAAAVTPPAKSATLKPICRNPGIVLAGAPDSVAIRPLADAAPARHIKAVVRSIEGCNAPVVINAEVGTPRR
ncbi:hypothetical protein AB5I39_09295 [Sphingomonas sp. MMS24-J45]|uniref:hypothetical protein n=1 Tax=Sphingomonas sp. MMS24-J45 TaxID=3238806 RepID=UPI00384A60C2